MIVIIGPKNSAGEEIYYTDVAAVVRDHRGNLRLCRDSKPDEYIDDDDVMTVVNDG